MALVTSQEISGSSVYGIRQMSYSVGGAAGQSYDKAVAVAALMQAKSFEAECNAITAMVRVRMKKLDDLGIALGITAEAVASMPVKKPKPSHKIYAEDSGVDLGTLKTMLSRYGLNSGYVSWDKDDGYYITRENASYAQNDIQYSIDREDNDLQQDMVTIQGMFTKRDNAFSTASRLLNKIFNASQSITSNFGG